MKVYEVHYDNGEQWEDAFSCSECFYATYEGAVKYLEEELGLVKNYDDRFKSITWESPKYVCKMNNIDCYDCEYYYDSDSYNGQAFIDEDGEETDECPELFDRLASDHDFSCYTIVEHDVKE